MRHVHDMVVQADDKVMRLAPGAQIRDANNRIVLPVSLPAGSRVRYTIDREGMIDRVWIVAPPTADRRPGR